MNNQVHFRRLQQWSKLVLEAENSSNKFLWCKENGIPYRQYMYWQKLVREYILANGEKSLNEAHQEKPDAGPVSHELVDITSKACTQPASVKAAVSPAEIPSVPCPAPSSGMQPELMLEYREFHIYIRDNVSQETLAAVLKAVKNA